MRDKGEAFYMAVFWCTIHIDVEEMDGTMLLSFQLNVEHPPLGHGHANTLPVRPNNTKTPP